LNILHTIIRFAIGAILITACTGNVVREEARAQGKIKNVEAVSDDDRGVEFFGLTYRMGNDSSRTEMSGVDVTAVELGGSSENIVSNDTGYYHLDLAFGKRYEIFFSIEGAYTKFVEIDTRFVSEEERQAGYRMPTDMNMETAVNGEVFDFYSSEAIGRARADSETGILDWDFEYTRKQKQKLERLKDVAI